MKHHLDPTKAKILLTGGSGFLGSYIKKELLKVGIKGKNINIPRSIDNDLRKKSNCLRLTKNIDIVIHAAGNVGGIGKNRQLPGTLFYDNAIMGIELMEAARKNNVKKFVTLGTVCAYPKLTSVPFKEAHIWDGYPEETNAPYGLAKKMLLVQGQAYRKQFNFNAIYLLPVNLYGPGDNFDLESSHVIPALIRKIAEAKRFKLNEVKVWGTGEASREFLYIEDAAKAVVLATFYYDAAEPINIGANSEIKIKNLVELLCKIMRYKGEVKWDKSKPDGQPRRKLDTTMAKKHFKFEAKTSLTAGLKRTIDWYTKNSK